MTEKKNMQNTEQDPLEQSSAEAAQAASASPEKHGKNKKRAVAVVLAVVIAAVGFLAGWLGSWYSRDARLRKLSWLIDTLEDNYYQDVDLDALYDELYDAVVPDRFSYFYTAAEYDRLVAESEGQNEGVGISMLQEDGSIRLYSVVENSPACLAGLEKGMYILGWSEAGGEVSSGSVEELSTFISAQDGDFVLYADHSSDGTASAENAYTVKKSEYLAAYCLYRDSGSTYAFRGETSLTLTNVTETEGALAGLDEDTAYIRLDGFDGNCASEFAACLALMKERGRTNLIIDLRGNGGGYMTSLQSIASHLLRNAERSDPAVAIAVYRDGSRNTYRATGNDFSEYFTEKSRVTVLADENSASASECLIGALVDYGTIGYGDIYIRRDEETGVCRTYGKGVMQSTFTSLSGDAFRLTVAEIFWPNGRSIHGTGVTPEDDAVAVTAPLLPGETDTFLEQVIADLAG